MSGQIKVNDDGPLLVTGDVKLLDGEGNTIETKGRFWLCRCGLTSNKPFCNGAHAGKLESKVRTNKESS